MAVLSRIATLRLDDTATHTTNILSWVATAAVEQTAEGGSVDITTVRTIAGVPPLDPDTLSLRIYDDAGTLVRSFALNTTAATQTSTFFFTDTGATGGSPRHGTYEIALRATRTTTPGTYDVETDATPNTPPASFDTHLDRGYIIATTTKVHALSNLSLGGAKDQPAQYDESLFARITLGSASNVATALGVALSGGGPSGNTNSTAATTRDATFAGVVDDRFPAAVTTVVATVTAPNATLTGLPYTVFTATTTDSINVDPRLTVAAKDFQVDDDTFGTPPMSKNVPGRSALVSSYSGLAMRLVTARATGINGLSTNIALDPRGPGATINRASTTATRGGEAGWTELAQLGPFVVGGAWDATLTVTTADLDAPGYIISPTDVVTILAPDPRLDVDIDFGSTTASEADHLHSGDSVQVRLTLSSTETGKRVAPDAGSVKAQIIRYNRTLARWEYLVAGGASWANWAGTTTAADQHDMTDAGDGVSFTISIPSSSTATWGATDLVAIKGQAKIAGTPYGFKVARELTGDVNSHTNHTFDPTGLFA